MTVKVSLEELIKAGAHFGHQTRRWNPKMAEYIHTDRDGVHIFDLTKTKKNLDEALTVLTSVSKKGGGVMFVGTKKQAKTKVEEVGKSTESLYVTERWLGGTLTNFDQIKKSINRLADMKAKFEKGEYNERTKKERVLLKREVDRLERFFGGLSGMESLPDAIVVIDIKREKGAIKEAQMKGIDIIALVDTNCDPDGIDYLIPMNDDATRAISYVLDLMGEAILEGKGKNKSNTSRAGNKGSKGKK